MESTTFLAIHSAIADFEDLSSTELIELYESNHLDFSPTAPKLSQQYLSKKLHPHTVVIAVDYERPESQFTERINAWRFLDITLQTYPYYERVLADFTIKMPSNVAGVDEYFTDYLSDEQLERFGWQPRQEGTIDPDLEPYGGLSEIASIHAYGKPNEH